MYFPKNKSRKNVDLEQSLISLDWFHQRINNREIRSWSIKHINMTKSHHSDFCAIFNVYALKNSWPSMDYSIIQIGRVHWEEVYLPLYFMSQKQLNLISVEIINAGCNSSPFISIFTSVTSKFRRSIKFVRGKLTLDRISRSNKYTSFVVGVTHWYSFLWDQKPCNIHNAILRTHVVLFWTESRCFLNFKFNFFYPFLHRKCLDTFVII